MASYALINWGARQKIPQDAGDFRLLHHAPRRRCGSFRNAIASSRGWRAGSVSARSASTTSRSRATCVTTFSAGRLVGLSIEGLYRVFGGGRCVLRACSDVLLATAAFLFGLSILWETWTTGKIGSGDPSLVIGLMTIGGVQLIMIGIVGEYIGKILFGIEARPIYFVLNTVRSAQPRKQAPANGPRPNDHAARRAGSGCAPTTMASAPRQRAIAT